MCNLSTRTSVTYQPSLYRGEGRGEGISCNSNRMACTVNLYQSRKTGFQSRFTLTLALSRRGRGNCLANARVSQRSPLGEENSRQFRACPGIRQGRRRTPMAPSGANLQRTVRIAQAPSLSLAFRPDAHRAVDPVIPGIDRYVAAAHTADAVGYPLARRVCKILETRLQQHRELRAECVG